MHNQTQTFPRSAISISKGSEISIMLDSTDFAHAELIYYNYGENSFYALMGQHSVCLGHVPDDVAVDISSNMRLSLTAMNAEGNMVVLDTRIQCLH